MEAHSEGPDSAVTVEVGGLSIYTHHGVGEAEREVGQRLELDIALEVADCDAVLTDRLEDTVDYSAVCELATAAATERSFRTLERVCQVIAERLLKRFPACDVVRVRAAKPEPPIALPVGDVAVEVEVAREVEVEEEPE
jgi:7,8-dihydroneopterin aldolase/epimerase/oxygenase